MHPQQQLASRAAGDRQRWTALGVLSVAQFMVILDITVVNVALPAIGADLELDRAAVTWVVTAYVLTFGGLLLFGGRLADVIGRRRSFLLGLAIFTAASLVCGLAPEGWVLLTGRALQGTGAALLSPAALSIITTTFRGADRHRALGVWAALGGTGAAAGVLVGGLLTSGPGWQWVFYINLPVGIGVMLTLPALVPAVRPAADAGRLDLPGTALVITAMAMLVLGLVRAGDAGWAAAGTLVPVGLAVVALVALGWVERVVRTPLVPPALVGRRAVASGFLVMLAATGLLIAAFFLSSQYLQRTMQLTAIETGLAFLPVAIAIGIGAHIGARLVGRVGPRVVGVAGLVLAAAGAALMARLDTDTSLWAEFLPGFGVLGLGLGAALVTATTTAMSRIDHAEAGLLSGLVNTGHELGSALGVAVMSTVAVASLAVAPDAVAPVAGFRTAFIVAAVAAAAAALAFSLLLPPGRLPTSDAPAFAH